MPLVNDYLSIWGGCAKSIIHNSRNCLIIDKLHGKLGKTYAGLYKTQPVFATTDLDLLKAIVLDEPNKNINRTALDMPVDEIANDCILTAENDQWRRIRQASAPSFT